jgi:hypothetical protein
VCSENGPTSRYPCCISNEGGEKLWFSFLNQPSSFFFVPEFFFAPFPEATTFFMWCNWVTACANPAKTAVFVNMDETSLAMAYGGQRGNIKVTKREGQFRQRFVERLSSSERRQSVSLLVHLANIAEVHRELPQIFLGSARHFTGTFLANHRPAMPQGMYLWSNDRGWMTHAVCSVLLQAIHASLGELMQRYHVILVMDAHRAHINDAICRRATRLGMSLLYVPAKLTWLLQPADTHLFGQFKAAVRRKYTNGRLATHDGRMDKDQWLPLVCSALQESVIDKHWSRAFASNGLTNQQQDTSMYVRSMVGLTRHTFPTAKPSAAEIEYLLGMKNIPYAQLVPNMPVVTRARTADPRYYVPRATRLVPRSAEATPEVTEDSEPPVDGTAATSSGAGSASRGTASGSAGAPKRLASRSGSH